MIQNYLHFTKNKLTMALTLTFLILISYFAFLKLYWVLPFDTWDETFYLTQGYHRYCDFSWSAIYAGFYSLYFFIFNDPLFVYHVHTFLVSFVAVPFVIFLISFYLTESKSLSLLLSILSLFSSFNIPINPKIQLFNFSMLCLLFVGLMRAQNIRLYVVVLNLALYSIYLRQDNLLLYPFVLTFFFIYRFHVTLKNWIFVLLSICGLILTVTLGKSPFDKSRSLNAFFDWFSWEGTAHRYGLTDTSLANIRDNVFKNPQSVLDLLLNNFSAVQLHFLNNLELWGKRLVDFKLEFISDSLLQITILSLVCLVSAVYGFSYKKSKKISALFILFYFFLFTKCLATILFLSSRPKYYVELALLFPLLIFSVSHILSSKKWAFRWRSRRMLPSICFVIISTLLISLNQFEPKPNSDLTFTHIDRLKEELDKLDFANVHPVYSHEIDPLYFGNKTGVPNVFQFLAYREGNPSKNFIDYLEEKNFKILLLSSNLNFIERHHGLGLKDSKITLADYLKSKNCKPTGKVHHSKAQIIVCP